MLERSFIVQKRQLYILFNYSEVKLLQELYIFIILLNLLYRNLIMQAIQDIRAFIS